MRNTIYFPKTKIKNNKLAPMHSTDSLQLEFPYYGKGTMFVFIALLFEIRLWLQTGAL